MSHVIKVDRLGKRYVIGSATRSATLREAVSRAFATRFGITGRSVDATFWALRNVTFEAAAGDVIGIVGKNGAGKSTLLKILSRVTEPTAGRVELHGRVGSLLEIGTGFHQDLTGRENIYLNGAILGMMRAEIARKFDDIVGFAEVERFVDTPVKHYSSGMYLRLAFAVAAFLESEILLVDEVLAVGDVSFQQRCLGKMREVSASGRTVLFVSHQMAAVEALCNRCLYIRDGELKRSGTPREIIESYMAEGSGSRSSVVSLLNHSGRRSGSKPVMQSAILTGSTPAAGPVVRIGTRLDIQVAYSTDAPICPVLGVVVKNSYGVPIFGINNRIVPGFQFDVPCVSGAVTCHLSNLPLTPGTYAVDLYFGDRYQDVDVIYDAATFEVIAADVFGSGKLPGAECGPILWPATWTHAPALTAAVPAPQ
jgi:lipopolysaccharide transport system ATP-binding protein